MARGSRRGRGAKAAEAFARRDSLAPRGGHRARGAHGNDAEFGRRGMYTEHGRSSRATDSAQLAPVGATEHARDAASGAKTGGASTAPTASKSARLRAPRRASAARRRPRPPSPTRHPGPPRASARCRAVRHHLNRRAARYMESWTPGRPLSGQCDRRDGNLVQVEEPVVFIRKRLGGVALLSMLPGGCGKVGNK